MMFIIVGVENGQEEVSNFCSSPGENSCEGLYSLDVTDEHSAAVGEVGRRLNQMVPIAVSLCRSSKFTSHFMFLNFDIYFLWDRTMSKLICMYYFNMKVQH